MNKQQSEIFYEALKKVTRLPLSCELVMLEMGKKADIVHDLSIFQMSLQYFKKTETSVEDIFDDKNQIKKKHNKAFIDYITETTISNKSKQTLVQEELEQDFDVLSMRHIMYPLAIIDKDNIQDEEINLLEKALGNQQEFKKQYDTIYEQLMENEKMLGSQKENKKYIQLKTLYSIFYRIYVTKLLQELKVVDDDIYYNIFYITPNVVNFIKEIEYCKLDAKTAKRVLNVLKEEDKNQILGLMNIQNVENLKDEDFI